METQVSQNTPFTAEKDIPGMFLQFIQCYRMMEKAPLAAGYEVILKVVPRWQADHLCDHWRGKRKDFASFFLNLGTSNQIKFQQKFGITDHEDQAYFNLVEKDEIAALFAAAPIKNQLLHNMMLFFNNHGIDEKPTSKITLKNLPPKSKRFGNSKNWGDYILSLEPDYQALVLGMISAHYELKLKEVKS